MCAIFLIAGQKRVEMAYSDNHMTLTQRRNQAHSYLLDWSYWYQRNVLRNLPGAAPETRMDEGDAQTCDKNMPPNVMMPKHIARTDRAIMNMDDLKRAMIDVEYIFDGTNVEKLIYFVAKTGESESYYQSVLDSCLDFIVERR